jgi:hypothetical protein
VSSASCTSTVSPASTAACSRTARLSPSRNSPRILVTVVRQVWPLMVAATGNRLAPSPIAATCSSSSTTAAAGPRGTSVAVRIIEPMGINSRKSHAGRWTMLATAMAEDLK